MRLEIGPRDLEKSIVTAVRRDIGIKSQIPLQTAQQDVLALLDTIQADLFRKANDEYCEHRKLITVSDKFIPALNDKNLCLSPHCLTGSCEDKIKLMSAQNASAASKAPAMGAKSLCIPFNQPEELAGKGTKCINPEGSLVAQKFVLFGRSY